MTKHLNLRQQGFLFMVSALLLFPATSFAACAGSNMSGSSYCVYNSGVAVVGGSVDSANADPNNMLLATSMYPLEHYFANSIDQASQSITFPALPAKTYGNADFDPGATASSGLAVSYTSNNTSVATIVSGKIHIKGAGTATITASQAGNDNYLAAYLPAVDVSQTLTVGKASQSLTFPALPAKTYGNANFAPGAAASSGLSVHYASDNIVVATIIGKPSPDGGGVSYIHVVGAGTAIVTASQAGNNNYQAAANVSQTITVSKALLTITADNQSRNYYSANPALSWTASGFINSDTLAVLSGAPTLSTNADTNSAPGTYPITVAVGDLTAVNYSFTLVDGTMTVNQTTPEAPANVSAVGGNGSATVSFSPPVSNGGSFIYGYTVTSSPDGVVASSLESPITVSGLTNGTAYTFTVTATNAISKGPASAPSNVITPVAPTTTTTTTTTTLTMPATTTTTTTTLPGGLIGQPNSTIRIYLPDGEKAEYYLIGETPKLKANYRDAEGLDFEVTSVANWTSSDFQLAEVVTGVSKGGQVTFKGNGKVRIFAFLNGLMDSMDFQVGEDTLAKHHGNLIILAGGKTNDPNDNLQAAIQYLCNRIYQVFKVRMFTDDDIYYINSTTDQDFNGDGIADGIVDQPVKSVHALAEAILWATDQKDNDGPLYLYLMDHGYKNGNFQIDNGAILTASQLDAWLDEFETATGRTSVVMLEACYAGSFVSKLADSDRMIVTSSSPDQFSFFSPDGAVSFGQFFSNRLMTGETWEDAFDKAVLDINKIGPPYLAMNPQKSIGSAVTMSKVYGDFTMGSLFPEIKTYTPGANILANTTQSFNAQLGVSDTADVSVWAMVTPPNYQPPTVSEAYSTPALGLDQIVFSSQDGTPNYSGSYSFVNNGSYTVTYYAKDANNMVVSSPPQTFVVSGGVDVTTTTTTLPNQETIALFMQPNWNLMSSTIGFEVAATLGNGAQFTSVWKWDNGKWAASLPGQGDGEASYAQSKGFTLLVNIASGEGFWVNSATATEVNITGPPVYGDLQFATGWNLVGLKGAQTVTLVELTTSHPGMTSVK